MFLKRYRASVYIHSDVNLQMEPNAHFHSQVCHKTPQIVVNMLVRHALNPVEKILNL